MDRNGYFQSYMNFELGCHPVLSSKHASKTAKRPFCSICISIKNYFTTIQCICFFNYSCNTISVSKWVPYLCHEIFKVTALHHIQNTHSLTCICCSFRNKLWYVVPIQINEKNVYFGKSSNTCTQDSRKMYCSLIHTLLYCEYESK